MSRLSIQESSSSFELDCAPDGSGDYFAAITVSVDGFGGHADGHVVGAEWSAFVKALGLLEQNRKGEARFGSAMQGEFEVKIHSIDARGHMGVSGVVRYRRGGIEDWPRQELSFAFEFEPSKLVALARAAGEIKE